MNVKAMRSNTVSATGFAMVMILLSWLGSTSTNIAWGEETTPRIHLVAVADTNDPDIGDSVKADLNNVQSLFRANVPDQQLDIKPLSATQIDPPSILSTVKGLAIQPEHDTVVFYYAGHGAFDTQTREHILAPLQRLISMKDIRAAMQQLHPRLSVAITDTCSVFVQAGVAAAAYPRGKQLSPAFKSLFIDPAGLIAISSTKPGQSAAGDPNGGYFTFALAEYLQENQDRSLTWPDVLERVNDLVGIQHPSAKQTAYIVSGNRVPFGIVADRTRRSARLSGVEVLRVESKSPATSLRGRDGRNYYLVPGRDIITHINGSRVTTNAEVVAAVKNSPPNMVVRIYDTRVGTTKDYDVDLSGTK